MPVLIENDVNLAAVAERRIGAAQEIVDFFLFWVADGVGGALLLDDRLRRGVTGGARARSGFCSPPAPSGRTQPAAGGTGALEQWAERRRSPTWHTATA